jgi:hypothetical protein
MTSRARVNVGLRARVTARAGYDAEEACAWATNRGREPTNAQIRVASVDS